MPCARIPANLSAALDLACRLRRRWHAGPAAARAALTSTASPIVVDAYGAGPQPMIDGGMNNAAVRLYDQQGWEINNLEVVGGNPYGVFIGGNTSNATWTHFRLTNLNVHGAHYTTNNEHDSGEVVLETS